jgi:hypothetical protein
VYSGLFIFLKASLAMTPNFPFLIKLRKEKRKIQVLLSHEVLAIAFPNHLSFIAPLFHAVI